MKKMDTMLIIAVLLFAVALYYFIRPTEKGGTALVLIDGVEQKSFSLDIDGIYEIETKGHKNVLEIRGGYADITDASCPDKLCVNQKPIHLRGETIVCLPNRIVIEITGGKENTIDGKTG